MIKRALITLLTGSFFGAGGGIAGPSWAQEAQTASATKAGRAYYVAEFELKDPPLRASLTVSQSAETRK